MINHDLSQLAGKLGAIQAIDQTKQGANAWYVEVSGEIQYWNVVADGSWSRGQ
jgi:hypothetical protein